MPTLIAYPGAIQRAEAYTQLDSGEIWGPLWPFRPKDESSTASRTAESLKLTAGETFEGLVTRVAGGYTVETPVLNAGEYYPRIWRTASVIELHGEPLPPVEQTHFLGSFVNSLEQIEGLFESLLSIFRVVHPATDNLDSYGGAIRDIIILACTEVEAQWKGVLEAHNVKPKGKYYKTTDYVRLLPAMKLDAYELSLIRYPRISPTGPFIGWKAADPTQSLPWYTAYNNVKHDRERKFQEASLGHAIEAVAACVVMLAAQFGLEALQRHRLRSIFEFTYRPNWEPREWYYQPV